MGREEQVEEREVLESIFPDEITDISDVEFQVLVKLDIPGEEENDPPAFTLQVRYPEDYPDAPPHLDIHAVPNAPSHAQFSVANDREFLLAGVSETIEENLGMSMIFTLVSTLKEAAEQIVQDRKDAALAIREEEARAAEREENKKFHGSMVTPETFIKWRHEFLQEMEDVRVREEEERLAELKKARIKEPTKLSGRQLWERGLAGKGDEGEGEDDDVTEGVEKLKVEA